MMTFTLMIMMFMVAQGVIGKTTHITSRGVVTHDAVSMRTLGDPMHENNIDVIREDEDGEDEDDNYDYEDDNYDDDYEDDDYEDDDYEDDDYEDDDYEDDDYEDDK